MLRRIRKALAAGFGAGIGAGLTAVISAGKVDAESVGQGLGALLVVGVPVGWATWRIPNAQTKPTVGHSGSDRWTGGDRKDAQ